MFAALPTVLQPVAGRLGKGQTLQGVDRSFAGLRFKDLAAGTQAGPVRHPSPQLQAAATVRAQPPQPPRQQPVELYQGSTALAVSY
ncbi:hypothetical protein D3C78_1643990 [compost metagenome]